MHLLLKDITDTFGKPWNSHWIRLKPENYYGTKFEGAELALREQLYI